MAQSPCRRAGCPFGVQVGGTFCRSILRDAWPSRFFGRITYIGGPRMAGNWSDIAKESRRALAIQRVARSVAWELLSQPKPKDFSRVPPGPAALTPEWLTAVLCKDHPGCKVIGINLGAASSGSGDRCAF